MTSSAARASRTSAGTVAVGSPRSRKNGMLSAAARGASSFSPRSMKPNWRAPAFRYSGTWPGHRRASHPGQVTRSHAEGLRLLLGLHSLLLDARSVKKGCVLDTMRSIKQAAQRGGVSAAPG